MSSHFVLMKTKDEGLHFRQHFDAAMEKFLTNSVCESKFCGIIAGLSTLSKVGRYFEKVGGERSEAEQFRPG